MIVLAAVRSAEPGWIGPGLFLVGAVLLALLFVKARPKLRERRHEAWRKAGLMPDQLDPYAAERDRDHPKE